jgi:glycosyltransferase involved in cell wall biosynthesis
VRAGTISVTDLPKVVLVGGHDVDARLELMRHLRNNFDITALGSEPALLDSFRTAGFAYRDYPLSRGVNPIGDLFTIAHLTAIFRKLKPHIVHTFDTKPGIWGPLAARLAGVPLIISTITGLGSLYANNDLKTRSIRLVYQSLQKATCRFSNLTIFQNHDDARQLISSEVVVEPKTRVVLGSGVPTEVFSPARVSEAQRMQLLRQLRISPNQIVVTMISRIIRSKGVLDFMNAARQIRHHYPNTHFLLVGPDDENSIERLNSEELSQLKEAISCPGPMQDIPSLLAVSDVFVLPSAYREGIPRVLLEAASMGLPIVTTNSPGCNEVVENSVNGFLIPPSAPSDLAGAVLRLLEQPELRQSFGQASRRRAIKRFDISVVAEQTESIYQQLLLGKVLP